MANKIDKIEDLGWLLTDQLKKLGGSYDDKFALYTAKQIQRIYKEFKKEIALIGTNLDKLAISDDDDYIMYMAKQLQYIYKEMEEKEA